MAVFVHKRLKEVNMKASLYDRIKRHSKSIGQAFFNDCRFSLELAFVRVGVSLSSYVNVKKLSSRLINRRDNIICEKLKADINPIIEKYSNNNTEGEFAYSSPIWVCWWQGTSSAPLIVQKCIESIQGNNKNRPVYIINQDNYDKYLDIPDYILELVRDGKIKLANFADYIRVSLISKYGGLWIDSTVFCSKEVPEECFSYPFFSCKSGSAFGYIANGKWTAYFIGGWKNNLIFSFVKEAFEEYWRNNVYTIDYFLIDYLIYMAYISIPAAKEMIDRVPINNQHRFFLRDAMLSEKAAADFSKYIYEDTYIYKLSYKALYGMETIDGEESIFSYLLRKKYM